MSSARTARPAHRQTHGAKNANPNPVGAARPRIQGENAESPGQLTPIRSLDVIDGARVSLIRSTVAVRACSIVIYLQRRSWSDGLGGFLKCEAAKTQRKNKEKRSVTPTQPAIASTARSIVCIFYLLLLVFFFCVFRFAARGCALILTCVTAHGSSFKATTYDAMDGDYHVAAAARAAVPTQALVCCPITDRYLSISNEMVGSGGRGARTGAWPRSRQPAPPTTVHAHHPTCPRPPPIYQFDRSLDRPRRPQMGLTGSAHGHATVRPVPSRH